MRFADRLRCMVVVLCLLGTAATACDRTSASDDDAADDDGSRKKKKRKKRSNDTQERDDDAVLAELERWVHDAQDAVFVDGNAELYWKIYSKEAQVVTARGPEPHPYDYVIPASRARDFVAFRDKLGRLPPLSNYKQRYENVKKSIDGDKAVLEWDAHAEWKQDEARHRAVYAERYTLRRDQEKQRWRVSEKRSFARSSTRPARPNEKAAHPNGVEQLYTAEFYAQLDAVVDRARLVGGAQLFWALTNAGRHPEAYQLAKTFVAVPRPIGEAFFLLGVSAERMHHAEETKKAYDQARALDARIYPPRPWGPPPPKTNTPAPSLMDWMRPASAATL